VAAGAGYPKAKEKFFFSSDTLFSYFGEFCALRSWPPNETLPAGAAKRGCPVTFGMSAGLEDSTFVPPKVTDALWSSLNI
jgi:hypothetical protein